MDQLGMGQANFDWYSGGPYFSIFFLRKNNYNNDGNMFIIRIMIIIFNNKNNLKIKIKLVFSSICHFEYSKIIAKILKFNSSESDGWYIETM